MAPPSFSSTTTPASLSDRRSGLWVMSVDPSTNTAVYFNTATGAMATEDPGGDTSVPGGVLGAGQTAWRPKDRDPLEKLVPVVHNMADIYKSFLIGKTGGLINLEENPSRIDEEPIGEEPIIRGDFVPSSEFDGTLLGYTFRLGHKGLGYYEESKKRKSRFDQREPSINESVSRQDIEDVEEKKIEEKKIEENEVEEKKTEDLTVPRIGQWEEVHPAESKFGSCVAVDHEEAELKNKQSKPRSRIKQSLEGI